MADDDFILKDLAARVEKSGVFPPRDRFRADHGSRLQALNDLERSHLLGKRGMFQVWTPAGLRRIASDVHFAEVELDRARLVLEEVQRLYRPHLDMPYKLDELAARLGWSDLNQLRRAVAIQPMQVFHTVDVLLEGEAGKFGIDENALLLDAAKVFGLEAGDAASEAPKKAPADPAPEHPQPRSTPGSPEPSRVGPKTERAVREETESAKRARQSGRWILAILALFVVGGVTAFAIGRVKQDVPDAPRCEIAPPNSSRIAAATKVAGQLKVVVAQANVDGGLTTEEQGVVERSFQQVPDALMVCQMILQSAVCLEQIGKSEAARDMRQYITTKCPNPTLPPAPTKADSSAPSVPSPLPSLPPRPTSSPRPTLRKFTCRYVVHVSTIDVASGIEVSAADRTEAVAQCSQKCAESRDTWKKCQVQ